MRDCWWYTGGLLIRIQKVDNGHIIKDITVRKFLFFTIEILNLNYLKFLHYFYAAC